MRRNILCFVLGVLALAGGMLAFRWINSADREVPSEDALVDAAKSSGAAPASSDPELRGEDILADGYQSWAAHGGLTIVYPLDDALFPPEIVAPTFRWTDANAESDTWLVTFKFQDERQPLHALTQRTDWTPSQEQWQEIKQRSRVKAATVTIFGVNRRRPKQILSDGSIAISTSEDDVGAPLFYREINLPFIEAVKDPTRIRWRFGPISSPRPPVVLEHLPVCGNCHSFSAEGNALGMDVDYANTKGSYVITQVAAQMTLATSDIITWDDYRKEDKELSLGLLSQISPNGKFVVSTVKDRSVFVPKPGLAFSQLFFPIKGILCIYNRQTRTFQALPGADDRRYVQSNPTWSPDGKYLVFARAESYQLKRAQTRGEVLLTGEDCKEFIEDGKPFRFDLYRIPFNDGQGGEPEPLQGASNNGLSNFFARYSPNGKWIVFCRAKNYMLLQPDSELYIIPSEGGEARRLRCNTHLMNSWHSWSPNSRWLVFSSKANSVYTRLFLTHIDDDGQSTPPIELSQFTDPDRAANIPEFVNVSGTAITKIHEQFLNDSSYVRSGNEFYRAREYDSAIDKYRAALKVNPNNLEAHLRLTMVCACKKLYDEAKVHHARSKALCASDPLGAYYVGLWLMGEKRYGEAVFCLSLALSEAPPGRIEKPSLVDLHHKLGLAFCYENMFDQSVKELSEAVRLDPDNGELYYGLALAVACQGKEGALAEALKHYAKAMSLQPDIDRSATLHRTLAMRYAQADQFPEAVSAETRALEIAQATGNPEAVAQIRRELELYQQGKRLPRTDKTPGTPTLTGSPEK